MYCVIYQQYLVIFYFYFIEARFYRKERGASDYSESFPLAVSGQKTYNRALLIHEKKCIQNNYR